MRDAEHGPPPPPLTMGRIRTVAACVVAAWLVALCAADVVHTPVLASGAGPAVQDPADRLATRLAAGQPPFGPSPRSVNTAGQALENVTALDVDAEGNIYVVSPKGASVFGAAGAFARHLPAVEARGVFLDAAGRAILFQNSELIPDGAARMALVIPRVNGKPRNLRDIRAAAGLRSGEMVVADRETHSVARFSKDGKYTGLFAIGDPDRISVGSADSVAMLDWDKGAISIMSAKGTPFAPRITTGGVSKLRNPGDLAHDAAGNLYVLDREGPAVVIFGRGSTFLTRVNLTGSKQPVAIGLDRAGNLYVYDARAGILIFE